MSFLFVYKTMLLKQMSTHMPFVLLIMLLFEITTGKQKNSLYGQHLRVIWPRWNGNPKGLSGPLKGGLILEYLSSRFNFTYEMVRVTENRLDPPVNGRGLFTYLWEGVESFGVFSIRSICRCDLLLSDVLITSKRNEVLDLTWPWVSDVASFLIPVPDGAANMNAVIKPFQWPVWLLLAISTICVIFVLNLLQRISSLSEKVSLVSNQTCQVWTWSKGASLNKINGNEVYLYVFGNLLSQGGYCKLNRLPVRVLAGAWLLAAFILVQAYQSTLFIYVMAPTSSPLINSVYDVMDNTDINFLIKNGSSFESLFSSSNKTLYKKIQKRISEFPNSRCTLVSECVNLITPGSKNVFLDARTYQIDAIGENFKHTGKCNLQLARESFITMFASFALPKNSPYTKTVSQGILEMQENGIIKYWDLWYRPMPSLCLSNMKIGHKATSKGVSPALSLKNLTGGFIALLVGINLSFIVFLCELMWRKFILAQTKLDLLTKGRREKNIAY